MQAIAKHFRCCLSIAILTQVHKSRFHRLGAIYFGILAFAVPLAIHRDNMASRPVWETPEPATGDMMQPGRIHYGELMPTILAHSKI